MRIKFQNGEMVIGCVGVTVDADREIEGRIGDVIEKIRASEPVKLLRQAEERAATAERELGAAQVRVRGLPAAVAQAAAAGQDTSQLEDEHCRLSARLTTMGARLEGLRQGVKNARNKAYVHARAVAQKELAVLEQDAATKMAQARASAEASLEPILRQAWARLSSIRQTQQHLPPISPGEIEKWLAENCGLITNSMARG